ncbi:MAG: DUF4238 domain-containing protein, partial [Candidatus Korobacteraceae bacterium]
MPTAPRRHHYVTKAYLDGFLETGEACLYCYGRKRAQPFLAAPVNLANIRDYHSFKRADGSLDSSLETVIEREFESPGIPILRRLATGKTSLRFSQRFALASLIALQNVRVPYEREFMDRHYKEELLGYLREMDEASLRLGGPVNAVHVAVNSSGEEPKADAWRTFKRKDIEALLREREHDTDNFSREAFLQIAREMAVTYSRMKWTVYLTSGKGRFITTDCPVVTSFRNGPKLGAGIKDPDCEISFPLSSRTLLRMKHDHWSLKDPERKRYPWKRRKTAGRNSAIELIQVDDNAVRLHNECHVDQAYMWTFSGAVQGWL